MWQCHHKDKASADEVLNQRQLLSRVALRTIRFTLSDIQCGADKNWQTKTTWWFTLDQFMFLKVILRIISTTLRLCFVQQKQLDDLSEYSPHEHVLCSIHCDTQSSIKSCFYRVSQWVLSDALAMSLNQGAVTHLYEPHEPTKNRKIKKSWPINAMIASWGFSIDQVMRVLAMNDASLFDNLTEPRGESIIRIFIVQITPRSSDSPIKSSPTPHDPIPLI